MTREEIDKLWNRALREAIEDGNMCTRYHFAALVAAAERERFIQTVQSMKAELEAKFEKTYMEGAMAGAATEREACAQICEDHFASDGHWCAKQIRLRG